MKLFSLLLLNNFLQPFELKALLNAFSQMVFINSMNVNKTALPAAKGFYHSALQAMKHGSWEQP